MVSIASMCRLFGFRSVLQSGVHSSLISADNAMMHQSQFHPDGWGVAYYIGGVPHVVKSTESAVSDTLFHKVSGVVSARTVLAHIRKATHGDIHSMLNAHPFQYGRWIFAHNGNVVDFDNFKKQVREKISPALKRFILGKTDSELMFYFLLSKISEEFPLHLPVSDSKKFMNVIKKAIAELSYMVGTVTNNRLKGLPTENYLTFLITNGDLMLGFQGGQRLHFSTHKHACPERNNCDFFNTSCENTFNEGDAVNHLLLSSEPLQGENVWRELSIGDLVMIDEKMKIQKSRQEIHYQEPE